MKTRTSFDLLPGCGHRTTEIDLEIIDGIHIALAARGQKKMNKNNFKDCPTLNPSGEGREFKSVTILQLIKKIEEKLQEIKDSWDGEKPMYIEGLKNELADVHNFAAMALENLENPTQPYTTCKCGDEIRPEWNDSGQTCAACFKTYCNSCMPKDYDICHVCIDNNNVAVSCFDKNDALFISGDILTNEKSPARRKILKITDSEITHASLETGINRITKIEDFIRDGWVVNEMMKFFKLNKNYECFTKCKFKNHMIGSMGCSACEHEIETNIDQGYVICKLYNKANKNDTN